MAPSKLAIFILAFTLVAAAALRIAGISAKTIMATDETPSYISAAGNGSEYYDIIFFDQKPVGEWVLAAEWKKFMQLERPFCFGAIAHTLARFDIHPPLYFWLLHLWALIVGINFWTGPALNILISCVAALCLYGLARRILGRPLEAAVVAFTWTLSPAVFQMSFEARHYDLLALVAILYVWQIIRYADSHETPKARDFIFIVVLTAAGALTHYYFSILVAGCGLYAIVKLARKQKKRLIMGLGAVLSGYAVFVLLHPNFYQSFMNEQKEVGVFSYENLLTRIGDVVDTFKQFFFFPFSLRYIFFLGILAWLVSAYRTRRWIPFKSKFDYTGMQILYFFLWPAGVQIALYLAYLSPQHAALPKHFAMAWPFLAFLPAFILRLFKKYQILLTIFFWLFLCAASIRGLQSFNEYAARQPDPSAILQSAQAIVFDNASINVLPRLIAKLPDDKPVFAASRNYMLHHRAAWLNRLDSSAVYVSVNAPLLNGSAADQKTICALISIKHETELVKGGVWGFGDLIRINRKLHE
jgi:4-amino-4-deoxy-L-arabinose transferase-like glycosyltransferase